MSKASVYMTLEAPGDRHDAAAIKQALDQLPGVLSVSVSRDSGRVAVAYDTTGVSGGRIEQELKHMGYRFHSGSAQEHVM